MDPLTIGAIILGAKALGPLSKAVDEALTERARWRAKWRSLQTGMFPSHVKKLLGEPKRVAVDGPTMVYQYTRKAMIVFSDLRVVAWQEP